MSNPHGDARGDETGRLREDAARLGAPLDEAQAAALLRLLDELAQWNRAYNLTAITAREAMVTHHLLDSLAGHGRVRGARVLDLGTGAGFPGLPLALLDRQRHYVLLDGTAKKVRFVAHAARALGLANVQAVHGRAGEWQADAPFDTVIARAVAPAGELAALAAPLLAPGGQLLLWKGRRAEAEQELGAMGRSGEWLATIDEVDVPGLGAERCFVRMVRG